MMATSGSFDFNLTLNQIIELAYSKLGVYPDGGSLTNEQYSRAKKLLNAMVKNMAVDDIYLWQNDWITQALSDSDVALGTDGDDYECIRPHTSSAANKPITGGQYMSFWKQLSTSAGSAWVTSTAYTSICSFTLPASVILIDQAKIREDTSDTPLHSMTREEYFNYSELTSSAKPNRFWFQRMATPEIYLYPYPDDADNYVIELYAYKMPDDFDSGTNNPDYLQEWIKPLIDGLAVELAPAQGIFGDQLDQLIRIKNDSIRLAKGGNRERGNTYMTPRLK